TLGPLHTEPGGADRLARGGGVDGHSSDAPRAASSPTTCSTLSPMEEGGRGGDDLQEHSGCLPLDPCENGASRLLLAAQEPLEVLRGLAAGGHGWIDPDGRAIGPRVDLVEVLSSTPSEDD